MAKRILILKERNMVTSNKLAGKIIKLVADGSEAINNYPIKSQIVLFIGMTGVGKSTLINYLNGVDLESFSSNGGVSYKLKVKDANKELPGIKIGHSGVVSCTRYPGVYSPTEKLFSFIDMPGFGDTGDSNDGKSRIARDIANAYFRKMITDKSSAIKIILVVSHNELNDRAGNLPKSLRDLANFIQGIESADTAIVERIKHAIAIVVTKVATINNTDKLTKEIIGLKNAIQALGDNDIATAPLKIMLNAKKDNLQSAKNSKNLANQTVELDLKDFIKNSPALQTIKNMQDILQHVVDKGNFALFTTPTQDHHKNADEAIEINNLIDKKINFINKVDANIGIRVSEENAGGVIKAIDGLSILGKQLAESVNRDITKQLKNAFKEGDQKQINALKTKCEAIKGYTTLRTLKAFFDSANKELNFSTKTINKYSEYNNFLTVLVGLLPKADRQKYSDVKNWVDKLGLGLMLDAHITSISDIFSTPQTHYENGKLSIRGYYIKTSQADEAIAAHTDIKTIAIQALHTITIDNDLANTNSKCQGKLHSVNLAMIAPNIIVNGDKTIDLSGKDGSCLAKANNGSRGADGTPVGEARPGHNGGPGGNGADGAPGAPGGSAGHLFIACDAFINKEHLAVNLRGGIGAGGQEGGNGGDGGNGSGVTYKTISHTMFGRVIAEEITRDGWVPTGGDYRHASGRWDQPWRLVGGNGRHGGNGGQGGKGGDGGKKGECNILIASKAAAIDSKLSAIDGVAGADGISGVGGIGGLHGRHAEGVWHRGGDPDNYWNGWHMPHYVERGREANGVRPSSINANSRQLASSTPRQNFQTELLDYKIFLEQTVAKYPEIMGDFLHIFRKHCESIPFADLKVTIKDFLEEANSLESYALKHSNEIDCVPFYHALLARIKDFTLNTTMTPQETKVMEYLYAATLSSVARINATADNLLVINVYDYVKNLVNNDFSELQKYEAKQLKTYYQQQYQEQIEGKIAEASAFLKTLKQNISAKHQEIEPQIARLTQEIKDLMLSEAGHLELLQEKRRLLEETLHKKLVFNICSLAIQGVGMLYPPAGPIIAGVVNAGLTMASNPSFETVIAFANKATEMKSQLGALPKKETATQQEIDLFNRVHTIAKTIEPLIRDAQQLLSQKHEGDQRLAQLDSEIASINAYISGLSEYLATVPQVLGNYLDNIVQEVESFQAALNDKSLAALEISKLEMRQFFERIKQNIKAIVGKFGASNGFDMIATQMEEALDVTINICSRVQSYRDHIAFANYIAHLQTAEMQTINVDAEYQPIVDSLNLRIQQNIVKEAYYKAIAAVKQWAFPFAEKFLSAISNIEATDYATMVSNLTTILSKLQEYKVNITSMDQAIMLSAFNTKPIAAFYTWTYEQHSEKIAALLKGEDVILRADLNSSNLDGIKFKKIGIKLTCKLSAKQAELDNILQDGFKMTLAHSGISYYKYAGNVYQIASDKPLEIEYSFKTNADNATPIVHNGVWKKMAQGDILLSPYTAWIAKLESIQPSSSDTNLYDTFKEVLPYMEVVLTGEGSYIDTAKVNGDLHLDQHYYKVDAFEQLSEFAFEDNKPVDIALATRANLFQTTATTYISNPSAFFSATPRKSSLSTISDNPATGWYRDEEINTLLLHYLQDRPSTSLLTAMMGTNWQAGNTLRDQLIQFNQERARAIANQKTVDDHVIIPVNLGNYHWVLVCINYQQDLACLPDVHYIDPFGSPIHPHVRDALQNTQVFPNVEILEQCGLKLQHDGYNCGPWIIEIAQYLSRNNALPAPGTIDITQVREQQLADLASIRAANQLRR
jgi:GTP-binding protein EngB required for normal cell division